MTDHRLWKHQPSGIPWRFFYICSFQNDNAIIGATTVFTHRVSRMRSVVHVSVYTRRKIKQCHGTSPWNCQKTIKGWGLTHSLRTTGIVTTNVPIYYIGHTCCANRSSRLGSWNKIPLHCTLLQLQTCTKAQVRQESLSWHLQCVMKEIYSSIDVMTFKLHKNSQNVW